MDVQIFTVGDPAAVRLLRPVSAAAELKLIQAIQRKPGSLGQLPGEPGFPGAGIAEHSDFSHGKRIERMGAVRHCGLLRSDSQETGNKKNPPRRRVARKNQTRVNPPSNEW